MTGTLDQSTAPQQQAPERKVRWARRVSDANAVPFGGGERAHYSMMYGMPDPGLFPAQAVADATARAMQNAAAPALQYGELQGQPPLVRLLLDKLKADEGLDVSPDNMLITAGSAAAIGLLTRIFIDPGDVVLVEAPSFPGVMSVFRRAEADMRPLPMDSEGIDVEETERLVRRLHSEGVIPRILYTMPTFHNPLGTTLGASRRAALVELARQYNFTILEDDAYRDLHYDRASGALPESLYALDRAAGNVVRTGTFSKILAPGMRLGWALAPVEAINRMMLLKEEGGTNPFAQHVAIEFARDGNLSRHIESLVDSYREKRDAMLAALKTYMPEDATWTRPEGGFFVWLTLPASINPQAVAQAARTASVDYMPGERCFVGMPAPGTHMRLSFSTLPLGAIDEAVKRLAGAVEQGR